MVKLFISQPMKDRTREQILQDRSKMVEYVKSKTNDSIEVIDSFIEDAPHEVKPLWYLAKSLELMADADMVAFAADWDLYRGCRVEHLCAVEYNKICVYCE